MVRLAKRWVTQGLCSCRAPQPPPSSYGTKAIPGRRGEGRARPLAALPARCSGGAPGAAARGRCGLRGWGTGSAQRPPPASSGDGAGAAGPAERSCRSAAAGEAERLPARPALRRRWLGRAVPAPAPGAPRGRSVALLPAGGWSRAKGAGHPVGRCLLSPQPPCASRLWLLLQRWLEVTAKER